MSVYRKDFDESSNINEFIKATLNFLFFLTRRLYVHQKAQKAQKEHKANKAQKAQKAPKSTKSIKTQQSKSIKRK